jgi:hypothetical protein
MSCTCRARAQIDTPYLLSRLSQLSVTDTAIFTSAPEERSPQISPDLSSSRRLCAVSVSNTTKLTRTRCSVIGKKAQGKSQITRPDGLVRGNLSRADDDQRSASRCLDRSRMREASERGGRSPDLHHDTRDGSTALLLFLFLFLLSFVQFSPTLLDRNQSGDQIDCGMDLAEESWARPSCSFTTHGHGQSHKKWTWMWTEAAAYCDARSPGARPGPSGATVQRTAVSDTFMLPTLRMIINVTLHTGVQIL